jgi:hypothetical protein
MEAPIPVGNEADRIVEGHPVPPPPHPVQDAAPPGRSCHRPNQRPQHNRPPPNVLRVEEHYSKKGKLKQVCKECKKKTTWICPSCTNVALCPTEYFFKLPSPSRHVIPCVILL